MDMYRVTLTTTSTGMCLGFSHTREENTTSTSIVIDGLEENSIYTVMISALNNEFNAVRSTSGPTITTLEAGMFTYYIVVIQIFILGKREIHFVYAHRNHCLYHSYIHQLYQLFKKAVWLL